MLGNAEALLVVVKEGEEVLFRDFNLIGKPICEESYKADFGLDRTSVG